MAESTDYEFVLAPEITVGRNSAGQPCIRIGDIDLPFLTQGIVVTPPSLNGLATVTVTFLAERIVIEEPDAGAVVYGKADG